MKTRANRSSAIVILSMILSSVFCSSLNAAPGGEYYQLRKYSIENNKQEAAMDAYLENAYIPALKRAGIKDIGVFKTIEGKNDGQRFIMVFIPFQSMKTLEKLPGRLANDKKYQSAAKKFKEAPNDNPPYKRLETTITKAFSATPSYHQPELTGPESERVYELRRYHSATEELHRKKVKMFDDGESALFIHLGFEPLFFSSVIAGTEMPNLIYMICHENEAAQSANWKSFVDHPEWKKMSALEEYKNTVSHIDKWMLYPAAYSDL